MHSLKLIAEQDIDVFSLVGPPGAGKNVQGNVITLLLPQKKVRIIGASNVIRKYSAIEDDLGAALRADYERLKKKEVVVMSNLNDDLVQEAMDREIISVLQNQTDILGLDGFARTGPQARRFSCCRNLTVAHLLAEVEESLAGAKKRWEDAIAEGKTPREDDHPEYVKLRYGIQERDVGEALRMFKRITSRSPLVIPRNWTPREKSVALLKGMGYSGKELVSIVSAFDNPESKVSRYLAECNIAVRWPNRHLHSIFNPRDNGVTSVHALLRATSRHELSQLAA